MGKKFEWSPEAKRRRAERDLHKPLSRVARALKMERNYLRALLRKEGYYAPYTKMQKILDTLDKTKHAPDERTKQMLLAPADTGSFEKGSVGSSTPADVEEDEVSAIDRLKKENRELNRQFKQTVQELSIGEELIKAEIIRDPKQPISEIWNRLISGLNCLRQ